MVQNTIKTGLSVRFRYKKNIYMAILKLDGKAKAKQTAIPFLTSVDHSHLVLVQY